QWWGEVSVGGVSACAWFEIFKYSIAFNVLLGKPWLPTVRISHNYVADKLRICSQGRETVL
ncbi:hypothetical protein K438DRAFT_1478068, partial [Mycena galopus ATCC 62051]